MTWDRSGLAYEFLDKVPHEDVLGSVFALSVFFFALSVQGVFYIVGIFFALSVGCFCIMGRFSIVG